MEVMLEVGAGILRDNGIADPALALSQMLTEDLARRYGLHLVPQAVFITDDDPTQITAAHPESDLLLDLLIENWTLEPVRDHSPKYRVNYTARVRLIDAKDLHIIDGKKGTVIARGSCSRIPEETPNTPTYDDFLIHGAQRLIHELDVAAQFCLEEFQAKVLTASPTP